MVIDPLIGLQVIGKHDVVGSIMMIASLAAW